MDDLFITNNQNNQKSYKVFARDASCLPPFLSNCRSFASLAYFVEPFGLIEFLCILWAMDDLFTTCVQRFSTRKLSLGCFLFSSLTGTGRFHKIFPFSTP